MKIYFEFVLLVFVSFNLTCVEADSDKKMNQPDNKLVQQFQSMRRQMVESQIMRRGIKDSLVLRAMLEVERHQFVPANLQNKAYDDNPLPIGLDQTISQPYVVAFMTEQLQLKGGEKVLEIGTGSGYQAAVLAEIAAKVFTIEIVEALARQVKVRFQKLGCQNVIVRTGDGYQGWPEEAPFDAIIVTAAPSHVPQPLIEQLKIGGRMIIPVGGFNQDLILITKVSKDEIKKQRVLPVRFVPMTGKAESKSY